MKEIGFDEAVSKIKMRNNAVIIYPNSDAAVMTKKDILTIMETLRNAIADSEPDSDEWLDIGAAYEGIRMYVERNGWTNQE